jgi:hypothetical protein
MTEKDSPNEVEIIKTDKHFRNRVIALYFTILAGGALFITQWMPRVLTMVSHLHQHSSIFIGETVVIGFLLCFIFPAVYLISIGRKIKLHGQFPYPGMKVMMDTPVISGKKAIAKANVLMYFGACAVVFSIAGSIHMYFVFQKIAHSALLMQLPLF